MKTPENLVKAVKCLNPRAALLLDTNTIMDYPWLKSYEFAAPGLFLLVVPEVVYSEVMGIAKRKETDQNKRQRAWRTIEAMDQMLGHRVKNGIELANGHWVITVETPARSRFDEMSIEEHLVWKNLGEVDAALLRLASACAEDIPDTRTVLVTKDKDLTRVAGAKGVLTCRLPDLSSTKELEALLPDVRPSEVASIDDITSALDPMKKRPVKIAMTLEGVESGEEYMNARGVGRLAYDGAAYPLRWEYRYKDAEKLDASSLFEMIGKTGDMPIERLDFMGENVEGIPESVRLFACSMLKEAGWADTWTHVQAGLLARASTEKYLRFVWPDGNYSLQSPIARVRIAFAYMEAIHWGFYCCRKNRKLEWAYQSDGQDDGTVDLLEDYFGRCEDLMNLTADNIATYFSTFSHLYQDAFEMYRELADKVGRLRVRRKQAPEGSLDILIDRVPGRPEEGPESGLKWLLDVALDSWSIGQTREGEFTHSPFSM